jgi:hypothetical protein
MGTGCGGDRAADRAGDVDAVRWVAVRHAADHIHIVATLARQDGTKPRIWNDFYRVRESCQAMERRFALHVTAPGDRTVGRRPTRAESEHAGRLGWEEPARIALRRAVHTAAAGASNEEEFFVRLDAAGILVRKRFSQRDPGQVTGYAVARAGHLNRDGAPVWYGGGKLAADLTIPKLRARWPATGPGARQQTRSSIRLAAADQKAIWNGTANRAARAARTIRSCAVTDPVAAADAAWAASDALHVAASVLGRRQLRSRRSTLLWAHSSADPGREHVASLRTVARALGSRSRAGQAAVAVLVANLGKLAAAVAELREVQCHAAQAAAARPAAERLHKAAGAMPGRNRFAVAQRVSSSPGRARAAANLAGLDFPDGPKPPAPRGRPPTPARAPGHRSSELRRPRKSGP